MRREHRRLDYLRIYKDIKKRERERVRGAGRTRLNRKSNAVVNMREPDVGRARPGPRTRSRTRFIISLFIQRHNLDADAPSSPEGRRIIIVIIIIMGKANWYEGRKLLEVRKRKMGPVKAPP